MKYCPNVTCPFFLETGEVAEYQEQIEFCADCGELLETGAAPKLKLPPTHKLFWQQRATTTPAILPTDAIVTLGVLETLTDAEFLQERLAFQRIPAVIVPLETSNATDAQSDDSTHFALQVLDSDYLRATQILETLDEEEEETDADLLDEDQADLPTDSDSWSDVSVATDNLDHLDDEPYPTSDEDTSAMATPTDTLKKLLALLLIAVLLGSALFFVLKF